MQTTDGIQLIHDLVRSGRISPRTGAELLELRRELAMRRTFVWRALDAVTLGPLRRRVKAVIVVSRAVGELQGWR